MRKKDKWIVGTLLLFGGIFFILQVIRENEFVEGTNKITNQRFGRLIKDYSIEAGRNQFKERLKERTVQLRRRCVDILSSNNSNVNAGKVYTFLKANSYILCNVHKCGSTYWTQAFLAIAGHLDKDHFEKIDRQHIHLHLKAKITLRDRNPNSNETLILITRNPWHRLYSAYMDKIFRLQMYFVKEVQPMLGEQGQYSGKIPTFQQFLAFIISSHQNGRALEPHWRPISNLCHVCRYQYKYVLKMETFVEDSVYLLSEIFHNNISESRVFHSYLTNKHEIDEINKLVRHFTSEYHHYMRNVSSFSATMKRLWISFQSQGLISDHVIFNQHLFENLSPDNVSEIVDIFYSKRNEKILSPAEKHQQRQKHFNNAYSKIDDDILKGIQEVYANDFLLFSYDQDIKAYL